MKLLTSALRKAIPSLRATEQERDPLVRCKFFTPWSHWSWYVIEFDGSDIFFGWVDGDFPEAGLFSLGELESVRGPLGLTIERDRYFKPTPLSKVKSGDVSYFRVLPTIGGYTVDFRLRQFRRVYDGIDGIPGIEFIDFESDEGRALWRKLEKSRTGIIGVPWLLLGACAGFVISYLFSV